MLCATFQTIMQCSNSKNIWTFFIIELRCIYCVSACLFLTALPSNVRITDSGLTANTVELNSSTTLYCSATGTSPLQYQWYHNGTTIPGATSTTYMVTSAQFSSAGVYTCVVSNWAGRSSGTYPLRVQGTDVYRHCITRCRIMSSSMPE